MLLMKADFEVVERLVSVQEKNPANQTIRHYESSQGLRPHRLPTEGVSIEVKVGLVRRIDEQIRSGARTAVIQGIERLIRSLFPVVVGSCDNTDYDTFSRAAKGGITWFIYDQVYDGIGLAIRAYPTVDALFRKALDRVESCKCEDDDGCFRCIRNPDQEDLISKTDCIRTLRLICDALESGEFTDKTFHVDPLDAPETETECPTCEAAVRMGARFCSECGEKLTGEPE